jgi:hypothetical protein
MRINLHLEATPQPPKQLLAHWVELVAREYSVEPGQARGWLGSDKSREFLVEFLQSRGWRLKTYSAPEVGTGRCISYGFFVDDDCDQLIAWRLSQS